MLQSTFFDPVLGLDTHIVGIPAPPAPAPIPTPIPMPFVGMVFDPMGLAVGAAIGMATGGGPGIVLVNCMPVTNCGTDVTNKLTMPHIPAPGVMFIPPPMPSNDALLFFGSLNVTMAGSLGVRLGDIALSCNDPVRLPVSLVLAIPKGPLVLNMPPMVPDFQAIAMALGMKALGALAKKGMALFRKFRQGSAFFQRLSKKLGGCDPPAGAGRLRTMWSRAVRYVTGHPVDVVTGNLFTSDIDISLPGPLPLTIERVYESAGSGKAGALGYGWSHSLDESLWMERGRAVVRCGDGREIEFGLWDLPDRAMRPGDVLERLIHKMKLRCLSRGRFEVEQSNGRIHEFAAVPGGDPDVARLVRIRSRDGHHAIEMSYDARGQLDWVRDSAGRLLQLQHDTHGRLVALNLPAAHGTGWHNHRQYLYSHDGDLVEVKDAMGHSWRYAYQTHLLVQETERTGFSFYFQYNGVGAHARCVRTWGDGGVYDHVISYDQENRKTFVEDSLGHATAYSYNERNQVVAIANPLGQTTKMDYDPATGGRVLDVDPAGAATTRRYDKRGNLIEIKRPGGATTTLAYDDRDLPIQAVDPMGGSWSWSYNAGGLMTSRELPTGERTAFVWERGLLSRSIDAAGRAASVEYDDRKQVVAMTLPGQRTMRFRYDGLGRILDTTDARGGITRSQYDPEGRILETRRPSGVAQRVSYDAAGRVVEAQDGNRAVRLRYGGFHQLVRREEAGVGRDFHYDTEGRLTGMTNEAAERYTFTLDAAGRVSSETGFDGRTRTHRLDARGKVVETVLPSGRKRRMAYNDQGLVTRVDNGDGTFAAFAYRPDGKMTEAENQSTKVEMERDGLGRIVREVMDGAEIRSRYLLGGLRTEVSSSLGGRTLALPDAAGDIEQLYFGTADAGVTGPDVRFERDGVGLERTTRFRNGIDLEWQREPGGRPTARRTFRRLSDDALLPFGGAPGGREEVDARTYQWRGDDQIAAVIDVATGPRFYDHDARGNLVRERRGADVVERTVDATGNVYQAADRSDRRYGPGGRLEEAAGVRFENDADGNQIRRIDPDGSTWGYRWDGHGMLAAIERPDGSRVEFEYDAFARRIAKRRFKQQGDLERETRFVWDGHNVLHEIDNEEGITTWHWVPGTFTPIAREQRGQVRYVASDHLGTPTEMYDEIGRLAWKMQLDVYGVPSLDQGQRGDCPWRWPGQYDDDADAPGLVYNRHRYYAADQGGYLSDDPLFLLVDTPRGYCPDPLLQYDPLGWHLANAWFTPPGGARAPVGNPDMGGANRWPNVRGSGDADMAPNGLGRLGDSENLIMTHLDDTRAGQMDGGILEITSTRAHGSSLPPCPDCGVGMQNFADRHGVTVVYTQAGAHGPTGEPRVFHPETARTLPVTSFDWSALPRTYGDAGVVPQRLAEAAAAPDPEAALEIVESAAIFVLDAGSLNDGAPVFASDLFDAAGRRHQAGKPVWPFLRGIHRLATARAGLCDHFGLAPVNRLAPAADWRSAGDRLVYQDRQLQLHRALDEVVRGQAPLIEACLRAGQAEDRATAIVLAVLAGVKGPPAVRAAIEGLATESNDATRASLLLGLTRLAEDGGDGDANLVRQAIAVDLHAGGFRSLGAGVAALWRLDDFAGEERDLVVDRARAAMSHLDPRPLLDRFDYGWHDELPCGEAARAVYGSTLPAEAKAALLAEVVRSGPRVDHDDGLLASNSAAPAAWFLMRLSLARHYHRTTVLGPEDLSAGEREVIRLLATHRTWNYEAGILVPQFGIVAPFGQVAPRLLQEAPDVLSAIQPGTWEQRWVEWSRWKWLRAAVDQTQSMSKPRAAATAIASRTIIEGCDLDTAIAVVAAAAAEPGLPLEEMLVLLLDRADAGERPGAALQPDTDAALPDPGAGQPDGGPTSLPRRIRFARLVIEAAFGDAPDAETARKAMADVRAGERLRDRVLDLLDRRRRS